MNPDFTVENFDLSSRPSKFKIVFLGDQSVGKTSIINRFVYDGFEDAYASTIGVDFLTKTLYRNERVVRLLLWDTAGQERFKSLIPSYVKDSAVAVACFDVTSRESFQNVNTWIEEARAIRGDDLVIILVGNKSDLDSRRRVTSKEGEQKAEELGVPFVETSAKSGEKIAQLFTVLTNKIVGDEKDESRGLEAIESHGIKLRADATLDEGAEPTGGKKKPVGRTGCC